MELKKKVAGVGAGVLAAAGIVYLKNGGGGLKKFETFKSTEGRFSVSMPGGPEKVTQMIKSEVGEIDFTMFAADSEKYGFVVGYSDYPEEAFLGNEPIEMLGNIVDGVVFDVKGKLAKEVILENYGDAATEYEVIIPEKGTLTSRLILNDKRLYQLIVMFPEGGYDNTKEAKFFNSFKVNDSS